MASTSKRFYDLTLIKELEATIGNISKNKTCGMIDTTNEYHIITRTKGSWIDIG